MEANGWAVPYQEGNGFFPLRSILTEIPNNKLHNTAVNPPLNLWNLENHAGPGVFEITWSAIAQTKLNLPNCIFYHNITAFA